MTKKPRSEAGTRTTKGKRRGHGEGTIYLRSDGRWEARMSLGDGTGRHRSFLGKTRQEVARKLAAAQRDRDEGVYVDAQRQSLKAYLASWLEIKRAAVGETTWLAYERLIRVHIVPALGRLELGKLTAQHLQRLYADRLEAGAAAGSVRGLHRALYQAFGDATRLGLAARNVAALATPPKVRRQEQLVLTQEEVWRVLESAERDGDRLRALWTLALAVGMRVGELLALKWGDVELEGDEPSIVVQRSLKRVRRKVDGSSQESWIPILGDVKWLSSRRRIAIHGEVVEGLRAHRRRQLEERMRAGAAWLDQQLVFCSEVGGKLSAQQIRWAWFRRLRLAGMRRVRFHDTRHTAATLLLANGVPEKVVQEMLGHASIAITLGLYGHVTRDMQREAARVMSELLCRSV